MFQTKVIGQEGGLMITTLNLTLTMSFKVISRSTLFF